MKFELEPPIWYSEDKMYCSTIKESDVELYSNPVHSSSENKDICPPKDLQNEIRLSIIDVIHPQITSWFSIPLTKESLNKRLQFQFDTGNFELTNTTWVKVRWVPKYFQVRSKTFHLIFGIQSITASQPRIPTTFLEAMTPRATTPTEDQTSTPRKEVRNIVIHPGAGPNEDEVLNGIPFTEDSNSLKLRDSYTQERKKIREAQLRAAIARLKVEKLKERYLREYGAEADESSESGEDSMEESEFSDASSKK